MLGKKNYVKRKNVNVIKVLQYKGLSVKDRLRFAERHIHIERFSPKYDYLKNPNREWLCNVIYFIIP